MIFSQWRDTRVSFIYSAYPIPMFLLTRFGKVAVAG